MCGKRIHLLREVGGVSRAYLLVGMNLDKPPSAEKRVQHMYIEVTVSVLDRKHFNIFNLESWATFLRPCVDRCDHNII